MAWQSELILERVRRAAMRGVVRVSENVLQTAVRSILTGEKTGRIYRHRGVDHQASAPGESPASDTGRLAQSGRTSYNPQELTGTISFSTGYAHHLEFGTEKMEPRPFLRRALHSQRRSAQAEINDEIRKELAR